MLVEKLRTGFEVKDLDEKAGSVVGYGSVFGNVDHGGDVVAQKAFSESLKTRTPKFLLHHDPEKILGVISSAKEDDNGLLIEAKFNLEKQMSRDAFSDAKMGALDGLSIGYRAVDAKRDEKTGIRTIKKADLFEVSLVTFPMNERARLTSLKSMAAQITTIREFEDFLRDVGGFSLQSAKAIAAGGFKATDLRDVADAETMALRALTRSLNLKG
jgi:HK97 family phage prohead protease